MADLARARWRKQIALFMALNADDPVCFDRTGVCDGDVVPMPTLPLPLMRTVCIGTAAAWTGAVRVVGVAGTLVLGRLSAMERLAAVSGSSCLKPLSFGLAKSKQDNRSPLTARRHGLISGSRTPKRASMKRMTEVWSKTCEFTQPPLVHGEMTYIGTRGPRP